MKKGHTYAKKLSELQKLAACDAYASGDSIRTIAGRLGVDPSSIWSLLKRRGVPLRTYRESNRRLRLNDHAFDTVTEESAYFVGFIMADGSVCHRPYSSYLSVSVTESDRVILDRLRVFLGSDCAVGRCKPGGFSGSKTTVRISVASKTIVAALAKFGVLPNKSMTAKVVGLDNNRDFWRGAVDGDGFVCAAKSPYGPVPSIGLVGAKPMLKQFAEFVRTITGKRPSVYPLHRIWTVRVKCAPAVSVINALYAGCTVALPRKEKAAAAVVADYEARLEARRLSRICAVPNCGRNVEARGLCLKHYKRSRKHGSPFTVKDSWQNTYKAD